MAQKTGKVIVPTEPASRAMTITGFTFKSYDKKAGVLQFEIKNQDGSPTDLIDATVRLFMYIYQGEEKKEFPIFDNQIITESYMQGIVKYRIPDMLLSYEGKVDANVYIDFPDGSHTDNLAFTFNIEKSIIDGDVQLNGEYYFKDFQQLLDGVKQKAADAVNETLAKVEAVSENVSSAQNDLTILEDRIDQTNQEIAAVLSDVNKYNISKVNDRIDQANQKITAVLSDANKFHTDIDALKINKADKKDVNAQLAQKVDKNATDLSINMFNENDRNVLQGQEPGTINAVLGVGNVQNENLADSSVSHSKLDFVKPGVNLHDRSRDINDMLIEGDGRLIPYEAGEYSTVGYFVPIYEGRTYTMHYFRKMVFFDTNKNPIESDFIDGASSSINSFTAKYDGYIRYTYRQDNAKFMLVEGDTLPEEFVPYNVIFENVALDPEQEKRLLRKARPKEILAEETKFIKKNTSKNLFDKSNVYLNRFDGREPYPDYFEMRDWLFLEKNTTYTITKVRVYYIVEEDRVTTYDRVNTNNNDAVVTFTTPDRYLLLKISGAIDRLGSTQIEVGPESTPYVPYESSYTIEDLRLTDAQISEVRGDEVSHISVTKHGENFTLSSKFDSKSDITIKTVRDGSYNNTFNFISTTIGGRLIHYNTDDITPIRTFATVGANHGYTSVVEIPLSGHDKTDLDLGSQWSDGVTTYVLLRIEGSYLYLAPPYTIDGEGIVDSNYISPVADLEHVSGATNDSAIPIATHRQGQLRPCVNNISVKYILDGVEITEDGTYYGSVLKVKEVYTLMDYKAILDFAKSNIGVSYLNDDVEGTVKLSNTFTFTKGLKCSTTHGFTALTKLRIKDCGFLQSVKLASSGYTTKRFIPNTLPVENGDDFTKGVDMMLYNTNNYIRNSNLVDPAQPPNHYVDWVFDTKGNKFAGFSMGYIPDKTDSANDKRLANTNTYWDLRSTGKSYPVAIAYQTLEAGTYKQFQGFRNYLSPEDMIAGADVNTVSDDKETYVFIDAYEDLNTANFELVDALGKPLEVVQTAGISVMNDTVGNEGVVFNALNLGSGVVKIK